MAVLVLTNGNPPGQVIEVTGPEVLIGRLPRCEIVLDPHGVSREHAKIRRKGDQYFIIDLESRNKTKLNERVLAPLQDHQLKQGDRINICDVEMVFYYNLPQASRPGEDGDGAVTITEGADDSTIHTLDASRSDLLSVSVKPEVKLKAILDISRNLSSALKLDVVAPKALESLLDVFPQAERAFLVLLKDAEKRTIRQTFHKVRPAKRPGGLRGSLGSSYGDESRMTISRSILNHVLGQKKAVLSQDAGNDKDLPVSASIADLKIRSIMCAPMLTPDGQAVGILQLDTSDRRQFLQDDLDVLLAVASQAAIAIQNAQMHETLLAQDRINRDLNLAEQVQRRFLPQAVPVYHGWEFFAHYLAAYQVGGDYYDFVPLPGGRLAIALGDVAGKGVAAALMMAKFSGDTRYCILTENAPAAAADALNALLCDAGLDERFITLSLSVLDLASRELTLASAGHLPVLIRRASGKLEEVGADITGFPLGIMDDSTYDQIRITLGPGDVAIVYSDGVTDPRSASGELYHSQEHPRLLRRVAESSGGPAAIGKAILQEIREFSANAPQADDITLVCFGPTHG